MSADYENFYRDMAIGVLILDENSKIQYKNNWIKERSNSDSLVIGKCITEYVDDQSSKRFLKAIEDSLEYERGSILTDKLNGTPIRLKHGVIDLTYNLFVSTLENDKRVLIQFVDVSQIKGREAFLKEKQEELILEKEKFFQHERMASLGDMTTNIAHEINNPLTIVESSVMLIGRTLKKREQLDEQIQKFLDQAKNNIFRITNLISAVRNLARKPKKEEMKAETVSDVLQDTLTIFIERANSCGTQLRINLDEPGFKEKVFCSKPMLGQVFFNLFNNAFYEIEKTESPWIEISTKKIESQIIISFTDSGKGISDEVAEKIFLPFFTTKDVNVGKGLGLSTSYQIIEFHEGKLSINQDCPNTQFVIELPLV